MIELDLSKQDYKRMSEVYASAIDSIESIVSYVTSFEDARIAIINIIKLSDNAIDNVWNDYIERTRSRADIITAS